ncbi:MAG TPA: helix-turn-helix transcriptional regulator [Thermoanaerobaculia bacterium]|nr:helix-turn-helix transcriptional regulator [Thermoanaerobaculia bacterium]
MIGEKIREARTAQQRSLADVAKKAKISIATLSRIETDKQTLDLGLFLTLAKVLDRPPNELLGDSATEGNGVDPLVRKIVTIEAKERVHLWRELAVVQRAQSVKSRRLQMDQLAHQVEELLAQIDFMREELENVRRRLRRSSR